MLSARHPAPSSECSFWTDYPLHRRPLYRTIPLPQVEAPDGGFEDQMAPSAPLPFSPVNTDAEPSLVLGHQNLSHSAGISITLNPAFEQIHFIPRGRARVGTASSAMLNHSSQEMLTEWAHEPATTPSATHLTIVSESTRHVILVQPKHRTTGAGFVVTVKDVLDAIDQVFLSEHGDIRVRRGNHYIGGDHVPRYERGGLSVVSNALRLCWSTVGNMTDPQPCNFIIRRQ